MNERTEEAPVNEMTREMGEDAFSFSFNPYAGTPEEIADIYMRNASDTDPLSSLLCDVTFFIETETCEEEDASTAYLSEWLERLVALVEENGIADSSLRAFCSLLEALTLSSAFNGVFRRLLTFFVRKAEKVPASRIYYDSLLNAAVAAGNGEDFDLLLSVSGMRTDGIENYPERNTALLDALFSHGCLLPGTEEGDRAFLRLIKARNPSSKILEKVIHPSYFQRRGRYSVPLLSIAVRNPAFSSDKYHFLIRESNDLYERSRMLYPLPPLGYAILSGERRKVDALISLGVNPDMEDGNGNNILHYILGAGMDCSLERVLEASPKSLLLKRNAFGNMPFDYLMKYRKPDYKRLPFADYMKTGRSLLVIASSHTAMRSGVENLLNGIRESLEERGETVTEVDSYETLRSFLDFNGNAVLYIGVVESQSWIDRREAESLLSVLSERSNIRVIMGTVMPFLHSRLILSWCGDRLVLGTSSAFMREYLLGESGNELIEENEGILLSDGTFHVIEFHTGLL